jgi:Ni,Fe-hydrogenase III small subunit/NAD-dependent dihydropyrimidine dehydrogenase PreA subunit
MWIFRGLRDGVVTTRWPARPDPYADTLRGPPAPYAAPGDDADLAALCPTGAIGRQDSGIITIDQGACIGCGRCVDTRADVFAWTTGPATGSATRSALVVPNLDATERIPHVRGLLHRRTRALRRSVHIRHVDAGSDGSDEWEVLALLNPVYDVHRLGVFFTASPRHADILLVTGAGARGMTEPLRRTYDGMPDPRVVIAAGTDAVSGGLHAGSYATTSGVGGTVPVDVWVPGAPPTPYALLHAILLATGRLTRSVGGTS